MSCRLLVLLAIASVGCGEARESPEDKQVTFQVINNSQFEIQDLDNQFRLTSSEGEAVPVGI